MKLANWLCFGAFVEQKVGNSYKKVGIRGPNFGVIHDASAGNAPFGSVKWRTNTSSNSSTNSAPLTGSGHGSGLANELISKYGFIFNRHRFCSLLVRNKIENWLETAHSST